MACPNCTRLERAIFQLIAGSSDTLETLQPAIAAQGVPLSPEAAALIDSLAQPGKERIAMGVVKKKRKASAYSKKFGKIFKQLAPRYKLKNGKWKVNGFRSAVRAAHKLAKK